MHPNSFLEATLDSYYVLTLRIWFLALQRVSRLGDAVKEHLELLGAIHDGDRSGPRTRCDGTWPDRGSDPPCALSDGHGQLVYP